MVLITLLLLGGLISLIAYYFIGQNNEHYWQKRGVKIYKKNKFVGPFWEFLFGDRALFQILHGIYNEHRKEPAVGLGTFVTPALYVIDPQNIQHVMQSDFQSFNHRGVDISKTDILNDNILFMDGNRWKLMRQNMSPLFTGTKLKNMYYIVDKCAQDFVTYLKENPKDLKGDMLQLLNTFCSAAVGAAVFGITTTSIFDSPFLEMASKALAPTSGNIVRFTLGSLIPSVIKKFRLKIFGSHEDFFVGAIRQVIRQRENDNVKKHDFADICVNLKKSGVLKDTVTGYEIQPTYEIFAAQAFFFYVAGVEPTANSIFATLVVLGRNPEILQKVHDEIDRVFDKCDGKLSYDTLNDMEYTDRVLSEALRILPPIGFNTRRCVRDTVLPVGNIKVSKGTQIFAPLFEIHHDPEYYPNPEKFDPDRFLDGNKANSVNYMPFGLGPRTCVGMRYARLQAKAGLVHLLRHFTVNRIAPEKFAFSKQTVQVRLDKVNLKLTPRDRSF